MKVKSSIFDKLNNPKYRISFGLAISAQINLLIKMPVYPHPRVTARYSQVFRKPRSLSERIREVLLPSSVTKNSQFSRNLK